MQVLLALIFSFFMLTANAQVAGSCGQLFVKPATVSISVPEKLHRLFSYWLVKLGDIKNADAKYFEQLKFRLLLAITPKTKSTRIIPLNQIEQMHEIKGWLEAEAKLAQRISAVKALTDIAPVTEFTGDILNQILPSKNAIRVLALADGKFVVYDGNGRVEALRAVSPDFTVEVEVVSVTNSSLEGLVRRIQSRSVDPGIRSLGHAAVSK